jgi:hypothetical protein
LPDDVSRRYSVFLLLDNAKKRYFIILLFIFYYITSCTLRTLLRLQFNLNKIRYIALIVFIEELLNIQYFLYFLVVCTRINLKVFQRVSKPHTVVHVRSMDLNSNDIFVGIIGMCGNSTSSQLIFPFKIVAAMILFISFFTGHLVTCSLGHLVVNLFGRAH